MSQQPMDYLNSNLSPGSDDSSAREKHITLRLALLKLHKTLLNMKRIDETLAAKEPVTPEYTSTAISLARKMFVPTESGDNFQKKYFEAIQRDPTVVIDHAELVRLFNNEPPDSASS